MSENEFKMAAVPSLSLQVTQQRVLTSSHARLTPEKSQRYHVKVFKKGQKYLKKAKLNFKWKRRKNPYLATAKIVISSTNSITTNDLAFFANI